MRTTVIIPSRYASTRLEGKPLIDIAGKPMIQRVYEAASRASLIDRIIVATDDDRIFNKVRGFGGEAAHTAPHHASGTDRIAEVAHHLSCDIVVNLQGDEPLMDPLLLDEVVRSVSDHDGIYMASAQTPIRRVEDRQNPHIVKVVADRNHYALYFSRSPIPYRWSPWYSCSPTWRPTSRVWSSGWTGVSTTAARAFSSSHRRRATDRRSAAFTSRSDRKFSRNERGHFSRARSDTKGLHILSSRT